MSPLEFIRPTGWQPDIAAIAIVCPHHTDSVIATYVMEADGTEVVVPTDGFSSESVVGRDLGLRKDQVPDWLGLPTAVVEGDVPHFIHRFRCTRPSCGYDALRRTDDRLGQQGMWSLTTSMLAAMRLEGVATLTVTNVDGLWRIVDA